MNKAKVVISFMGCAVALVAGAADATRQVATAEELYQAITNLNGSSNKPIIELTGSAYDVSAYKMTGKKTNGTDCPCHLYVNGLIIRGRSTNPRDTVIYGNHTERVFFIRNTTLQHLTISNGYTTAHYGPGVCGYATDSGTCTNCVITGNEGVDSIDNGGAGYVTLRGCEVCNNKGGHGGGASWCNVYGGTIHDNTASKSGGGGLCLNAYGVKIYHNTASKGGGVSHNSTGTLDGCEIYGNTATGSEGGGGIMQISSKKKELTATNCVIWGNTALKGDGGAAKYATLIDCVVSNNVAVNAGACTLADVYASTICSNTATASGGASSISYIKSSAIYQNYAQNGGAGIAATFDECIISNNVAAQFGGGVYRCTVTNSTVVGNVAGSQGGGTYEGSIVGSHISKNLVRSAGSGNLYGGGVYGGTVTNSTIVGNAVAGADGYGGGTYAATLIDCDIYDNYAKVGSAVHNGRATDCVISNNASSTGVYTIRCTSALTRCRIDAQQIESPGAVMDCTFTGGGKAVTLVEGANVYTSGTFTADTTYWVNSQSTLAFVTNSLICDNTGNILLSGPRNFYNKKLSFVNCTFVSNCCDTTVSSVSETTTFTGAVEFVNCLFAGNYKKDGVTAADFSPESKTRSNAEFRNCLFQVPPPADFVCARYENIITNAPRFATSGAWPYALSHRSPARRKGVVADWMATANDIRGEGYPRLREGHVDIGCYQCWLTVPGTMLLFK